MRALRALSTASWEARPYCCEAYPPSAVRSSGIPITAAWATLDLLVLSATWSAPTALAEYAGAALAAYGLVATAFGAAGWVGAVRSDYTKQLIQSRFHAARIVAMYAIALPWLMVLMVHGVFLLLEN